MHNMIFKQKQNKEIYITYYLNLMENEENVS